MKPKLFCLICAACIFAGCISRSGGTTEESAEESTVPVQPHTISLQRAIDNPTPTGLGEIGSSITYTPLETSPRSLLRERLIINVSDAMILVSDNTHRLLMFDGQGKFVRQIGRIGNGPGEHLNISDFSLSPDGQLISFIDENRGVFEYDPGGNFLRNHPIPDDITDMPNEIIALNDGSAIIGSGNYSVRYHPSDVMLFVAGPDGTVRESFRSPRKRPTGVWFALCSLYPFEGNIRFHEPLSDTLYNFVRGELVPYVFFDFGARGVAPESYLDGNFANIHGWSLRRIHESTDGIFFDMEDYSRGETRYGFFDKRSGQTRVVGTEGFVNDIDGGLPFFPNFVTADGRPGCWVQAYKLKEHVAGLDAAEMTRLYGERFTRLATLTAGLAEDDNPVLITIGAGE